MHYIKTCFKVLPQPQLNDLFTCSAKLARCWQAGQGDHYHIPPPSPCCKLFPAQMKYLFACKIVRNFPSRDQHRSSSSAPQYRGEMGSWQTCKGCLKMFRFRMKSLYSSIPLLQPSLTKHHRFLKSRLPRFEPMCLFRSSSARSKADI